MSVNEGTQVSCTCSWFVSCTMHNVVFCGRVSYLVRLLNADVRRNIEITEFFNCQLQGLVEEIGHRNRIFDPGVAVLTL